MTSLIQDNLIVTGGAIVQAPTVVAGDLTVVVPLGNATYYLTKGSIAAISLPAPIAGSPLAGGQDGVRLTFFSRTAFAHVITSPVRGFNAKAGSGTATASAAANNRVTFEAQNGDWWVLDNLNFTIA